MKIMTYEERREQVRSKYRTRAEAFLARIDHKMVKKYGWTSSGSFYEETATDEYEWHGPCLRNEQNEVCVKVVLVESRVRGEEGDGVSFGLDMDSQHECFFSFMYGHWTQDVWVNIWDDEAVEARFRTVEEFEIDDLVESILDSVKGA